MHQFVSLKFEIGFGEVTDHVLGSDDKESTILLRFAKKSPGKTKTSVNIPLVRASDKVVLGNGQESHPGLIAHLEDRFYPSHPLGRASRSMEDDVAVTWE